ncbi:Uncharacterised protein [Starkeya nomas]|uniref:DUF2231 domain-containing protein n=1 Tax=Starkeya nomas TaxID=2666134 RepID=A0A5S9P0Y4_9HYPH|nr:DUF2231 domain-containing protein [Starkeya nomas]CAA0096767.1 Uncharacterised protein [Starkeya nomas]
MTIVDHPAPAVFIAPPIHPTLAAAPATCFVGALLTDLAYWRSAEMWADFSAWLISAGVVLGWLFLIAGLIEIALRPSVRIREGIWLYIAGNLVVLVLATLNMLVHTRDAWTSVVPWGLFLSAATFVALIGTASFGWLMIYRPRCGVTVQ